jgi:hypothetical protein
VRLGRQRAERHGGGHEPPADFLHRLDLIQWNYVPLPEPQQVSWPGRSPGAVLGQESLVPTRVCFRSLRYTQGRLFRSFRPFRSFRLLRPRPRRLLECHDDRRSPAVIFSLLAEADPAMIGERSGRHRAGIRGLVPGQHVFRDLLEADSSDG